MPDDTVNAISQETDEEDESVVIVSPDKSDITRRVEVSIPDVVAVLPLRNTVTFPGTVVPLTVQRESSRSLLADVLPDEKVIATIAQRHPDTDAPGPDDLYEIGTAMMVLKLFRVEEDRQNAIVHGLARIQVSEWITDGPYLRARVEIRKDDVPTGPRIDAQMLNTRELASQVIELSSNIPDEAGVVLDTIEQPGALADFLASNLQIETPAKQRILAELDVTKRLELVSTEMQRQIDLLELSGKIREKVRANIDKSQREYYLREQLQAIQKELGISDERGEEIAQLRKAVDEANMPDDVDEEARRELKRLEGLPAASPENTVLRTYIEVLCELPWNEATEDNLDVRQAETILDEDHYDLEKIKRRILEYLAVRKLAPESRGPILCFVGPPGVGKTSLGKSIARALGRRFIRMSLGGMRDEAELRGHRRTYVGSMPGRIIQEIRKAGTNNPVFMLDELDKVGQDFRGDPTSALLEILDPAQNGTFQDRYLGVPFDLSRVMFIGTANTSEPVPAALRDRMEVIDLPGYTEQEKLHIARRYLVKRQIEANGLTASQAKWKDEAIRRIISEYTRESGVRELERQIGTVCRGIAAKIAAGTARSRTVNRKLVRELLGPPSHESELAMRTSTPGVATGLAYTPVGGQIMFIEATRYPGTGKLQLTGQIGDVMRESAQAAMSLVRSQAEDEGIPAETFTEHDIHVHVPAGAVPKDGPSAGVTMVTALLSLVRGEPVRADVAMTGEISLRGLVLPIGGVKEKLLAAKRAGISTVIMPERNRKDLEDVPEDARKSLACHFVRHIDEVLATALDGKASGKGTSSGKTKRRKKKAARQL
ncbi:MAG: endopeptidase La [Planctomycetes bacterium]|jgi:ATP-dependent Lon protease|nr:endopeptidase La [Planctomycetota bacterium]